MKDEENRKHFKVYGEVEISVLAYTLEEAKEISQRIDLRDWKLIKVL